LFLGLIEAVLERAQRDAQADAVNGKKAGTIPVEQSPVENES